MDSRSAELYLKLCELPLDKQRRFMEWARDYINKLDKELEKKKEQKNVKV